MNELLQLKNVGEATLKDLALLGISSIESLKKQDPNSLYTKLCKLTKAKQDPCVWDIFSAIIHEANTGEKLPWWHWSHQRKTQAHDLDKLVPSSLS